uniref:Uncharacterized protein n=1 Tax=Triticum urartu TaxID=4572 RepID=A0A8R7RED8_TRIUA
SSYNTLPPPAISLLCSSQIHPRSAAAPWTRVLVPGDSEHLHPFPCTMNFPSSPWIHSEKKDRDPSTTREEFPMCVYTVLQLHHTVPSNSLPGDEDDDYDYYGDL